MSEHSTRDAAQRIHFFTGRLLTADDLHREQNYQRDRQRRHNLAFLGWGVARGLGVRVDAESQSVLVAPGAAIAPDGEELHVVAPLRTKLPAEGGTWLVVLQRQESPIDPTPSPSGTDHQDFNTILEDVGLSLASSENCAHGVPLARVRRGRSGWVRDPKFRARRIK